MGAEEDNSNNNNKSIMGVEKANEEDAPLRSDPNATVAAGADEDEDAPRPSTSTVAAPLADKTKKEDAQPSPSSSPRMLSSSMSPPSLLTGSTASTVGLEQDEDDEETGGGSSKPTAAAASSAVAAAGDVQGANNNNNNNNTNETGEGWSNNNAMLPGAVAVRGPSYRESTGDLDDVGWAARQALFGDDDDDDSESPSPPPPIQVESYAVPPSLSDEEIRRMILESATQAEVVVPIPEGNGDSGEDDEDDDDDDDVEGQHNNDEGNKSFPFLASSRLRYVAIVAVLVVVAAIAIAIAVPLTAQQRASTSNSSNATNNAPQTGTDENLLASVKYVEWQGSGGFAGAFQARNTLNPALADPVVSSGSVEVIRCGVRACLENDNNCVVGDLVYEPGCCVGANCTNETKCGEDCPAPPDSCYLTNPDDRMCVNSSCYTCHQDNGVDTYVLEDHIWNVDCLQVGTAIRPENNLEYKWAIFCGPVRAGPIVEENRDFGEYQCAATRIGANYSDDGGGGGGLLAAFLPCQFIQLAECGCGPADMYTFGYPAPTQPCVPGDGCPFLCEDAGKQHASELCRHFPGNISWWEGNNAFESTLFAENVMSDQYDLKIYIKGVDD